MILDWLFGDPHTSMHPVAVFGRFAMAVEKKWRRYGNGIRQGVAAWGCAVIPVTVITGMAVWSVMCWGGAVSTTMPGLLKRLCANTT